MTIHDLVYSLNAVGGIFTQLQPLSDPTAPAGDLLSTATPTSGDLVLIAKTIFNIVWRVVTILVWIISIGSLLATQAPPPLPKDSPDNSLKGKIRKSIWYVAYLKIISFCAANVGWARTLANPKMRSVFMHVALSLVSTTALEALAKDASVLAEGGSVDDLGEDDESKSKESDTTEKP